jgi:hypothetical protein
MSENPGFDKAVNDLTKPGTEPVRISLKINGLARTITVEPRTTLLEGFRSTRGGRRLSKAIGRCLPAKMTIASEEAFWANASEVNVRKWELNSWHDRLLPLLPFLS